MANILSAQTVFNNLVDIKITDTSKVITARGTVTNASELGGTIRYFQDNTAGLSAYFSASNTAFAKVKRGDSIEVTGTLKSFNGLLEVDPITAFKIISSGNTINPKVVAPADLALPANRSVLIRLNSGQFSDGKTTFVGNTNYNYTVGTTKVAVRVGNGSSLVNGNIPAINQTLDLVGINSVFTTTNQVTNQVLPRDSADLIFQGLAITQAVYPTNISTTSFKLNWSTNLASSTSISYGTSPTMLNTKLDTALVSTLHNLSISGLTPSTVYYVQVTSVANGLTVTSPIVPIITASLSTGEIRVYFNHTVDTTFSKTTAKPFAATGLKCETDFAARIAAATKTVDVAMYSNGDAVLVQALKDAATRGVRVRYITDKNNSINIFGDTSKLGFKLAQSYSDNLMHNKFFVIDAADVTKSWVYTGAMNWTNGQIYNDYNNALLIQDQSLAKIYTIEFEEMWGSTTANYDRTNSKFSVDKKDNTPHFLPINGKNVEIYFSPSDNGSRAIIKAFDGAKKDIQFENLVFTYYDYGTALANAVKRKLTVRGIVDNSALTATGTQTTYMSGQGVLIKPWTNGNIFHHKVGIIDASDASATADPILITGSYNWSNAGEKNNDENMFIIHDQSLTNIFVQEFEARWRESTSNILGVNDPALAAGLTLNIQPNPTNDFVKFNINNEVGSDLVISVYNNVGQILTSYVLNNAIGASERTLNVSDLSNGNYFVRITSGKSVLTQQFVVAK